MVGDVHEEDLGGRDCKHRGQDCDKLICPVNNENEGSSGRTMTGRCIDVMYETTIISGKDRMISGGCGGAQWVAWRWQLIIAWMVECHAQVFGWISWRFSGWWIAESLAFKGCTDRRIFHAYFQRHDLEFFTPEYKVTRARISGVCFLSGIEGEGLQFFGWHRHHLMSPVLEKTLRMREICLARKSNFSVKRETVCPPQNSCVPNPTVLGT